MKASFNKLNTVNSSWQHYIWTNKAEIIPDEISQIPGVKIKDIAEFKEHQLQPYLMEAIKKGNDLKPHFSEASDFLRFMALQKFGGIYTDMDCEIYNEQALLELMKKFDFIGGREITKSLSYYGSAFIAAKPNHPILNEAIAKDIRNHNLNADNPNYIKYPCSPYDKIYFNAPPLITMAYFAKNNIDGNIDIILPTWMILNATFARYKNIDCNYDAVTKAEFQQREANLKNLLSFYPLNAREEGVDDANIYYSIRDRANYDIIAADMFCGGWSENSKPIKKRHYYWRWQD